MWPRSQAGNEATSHAVSYTYPVPRQFFLIIIERMLKIWPGVGTWSGTGNKTKAEILLPEA